MGRCRPTGKGSRTATALHEAGVRERARGRCEGESQGEKVVVMVVVSRVPTISEVGLRV
jgi:hypothetical protein